MTRHIDDQPFFDAASNFALRQFLKGIRPKLKEPIVPWLAKHVDMTFDKTAAASGYYKPYPYQIEQLQATEDPDVHRITLCQSQRTGKSTIWRMALMKRFADGSCSALIAYPSLDLAIKQNVDCVKPLLTMIPEVKADLSIRGNVKIDSYHSPSTSSVAYFMGLGSPVLSVTAGFLVADEVDFVELQKSDDEDKNTSQLKNIWLRGQTFPDRLMISVSSPTQYTAPIWEEFKKGSMGYWHLRCLACGEYIIGNRLAFWSDKRQRWDGLQWEKDDGGNIIADSIVYRCPYCGNEHHEPDAVAMNENGKFIHEKPGHWHRSFQVGALANPHLWSWLEIATAQEEAHDTTDNNKYFHNSVLGMPFKYVKEGDASVSVEEANRRRQVEYPADLGSRICIVTAGVDQQKSEISDTKYFCSAVHGWDDNGNCWLLSAGTDNSLESLEARISARYYGNKVSVCLIDKGGFSTVDDLDPFVASHANCLYYKGTSAKSIDNKDFVLSKADRLFLCNAVGYQVKLLDLLYSPPRPRGYRWYFPISCDPEYLKQVNNVQPNTRMGKDENGWEYPNWAAFGNARRDFFDASKMSLAAMEIACSLLHASAFPSGHKPAFYVREQIAKLSHLKKTRR